MSLAAKCRLLFSIAVLFILTLALLVPYFWMGKLTEKAVLDSGRAVVGTIYEGHFKFDSEKSSSGLVMLDESGLVRGDQQSNVKWCPLRNGQVLPAWLDDTQRQMIEKLASAKRLRELADFNSSKRTYVNLVRANKQCLACHSAEGSAPAFGLGENIGAVVVDMPPAGIKGTVFMNRICIIFAGLLAIAGAIVAFYIIAQRLILSPIRQLRALVSNVAEGNLEVRCGIKTSDEFEKLGDALNVMLDNLLEGREKLHNANKQLDAKLTELSERNIELYKANKLKGEFLANMSHEFRTPLNAILGFADILKEKPADDIEKSKRYADNIIKSGRSLLSMITDLLELAKAEAGRIEVRLEKTSIQELCKGLVAFFSPLTEKQKIKVRLNVDDNIPAIKTDSGKVQQILYNLLSNAVKFTPEGGKVGIKAFMPDDKTVRIAVSDTGPGVAEADKKKIFEKFRQGDGSITRNQTGTGLGLAISIELARLLTGRIGLESQVGSGATFWLELPAIGDDDEDTGS